MSNKVVIVLLLFTSSAYAQGLVVIRVSWTQVIAQEDGTQIEADDLIYAVYDRDVMQEMCTTADITCSFEVGQGECGSLYAVARQISTGLESDPSNVIDVCADDYSSRLNSPYLQVVTNGI